MAAPATATSRHQKILAVLQDHPGGLTRPELQRTAGLGGLDDQAVRRLLVQLTRRGAARVEGRTKDRRYFLGGGEKLPERTQPARTASALPAAAAAPASRRPPVDYQPARLGDYRPNVTFHLSREARARLAAVIPPGAPEAWPRARRRRLGLDLAWDLARLEGIPGSRQDMEHLADGGEPPAGLALREAQALVNRLAASAFLLDPGGVPGVDAATVRNLSALLAENLLEAPEEEGRLRTRELALAGTAYRPPADPAFIAIEFLRTLELAAAVTDPFEQSFFLLVHLAYLQPFPAGSTGAALLAANLPLLRRGLEPVGCRGVPAAAFQAGLLEWWEQGRVEPLRDLFVSASAASRPRLAAQAGPNPFRLRFRAEIKALVRAVVLAGESGAAAEDRIRAQARARLPREDREGFQEAAEAELAALHDGNFARYGLASSQFAAWKASMS
jgi:hypothetical protein